MGYIKSLMIDPKYMRRDLFWYKKIKSTQLYKNIPLFFDRQLELIKFFQISHSYLFQYFFKYGFPDSKRYLRKLKNFFKDNMDETILLKRAYEESAFHYATRNLLAYEKYSHIIPYMGFINDHFKKPIKELKILDYGCCVSDIGLFLAIQGAQITIADLDDQKLNFAIWRYKQRNLNPKIIKIQDLKEYPRLIKSEYDLIIATEVFEHVKNPLKLLKNFTRALKSDGLLFDSVGIDFEREIGFDHLENAIKIGRSKKYKGYYNKHYNPLFPKEGLTSLFKKIG